MIIFTHVGSGHIFHDIISFRKMHAYLFIGTKTTDNQQLITKLVKNNKARILPCELQKIADVRNLRKLVKLKFNQKTAIVIENIDDATTEAQNAFLKNLEEPQENLIYILIAKNLNNVIDTIISRCEVIKIHSSGSKIQDKEKKTVAKFQSSNIDYKFDYLGKIKDRAEAIKFVENLVYFDRENGNYQNMENYLKTLSNLKKNGNVSLQLTNMLVSS